ncbi:unnamed protein product [Calicophoron daubneyi]|uniref:PHD-type domain-containing protein n=1 Tax=Calicophoron daubneyi TaxID=300641 RepID=A0AAV2T3W5_CALDB
MLKTSALNSNHAGPFKDRMDTDSLLSDFENSMDTLPGTPLGKCPDASDTDPAAPQVDRHGVASGVNHRREGRIKSETMLSRVGSFASITDVVSLEDIFEYDWADSDSESPSERSKESYVVQEMLADYLKIKSFKRKYPDLTRRTMDAYERSWLQQEGLVPVGRADLGLTALRTDEVMKLLQDDYPEVHTALSDLFRRRRFEKTAEIQKRQYEAARIERGEARAEAARRRAVDSAADFNHRLVTDRLTNRRCYWDLQTMQIHFPQPKYALLEPIDDPEGMFPVAVIPGQFAKHTETYTPEQLMHLPLSRCIYSQPTRKHRDPPPLPTNLRFGSLAPRGGEHTEEGNEAENKTTGNEPEGKETSGEGAEESNGPNECVTALSPKPSQSDRNSQPDQTPTKAKISDDSPIQCMVCKKEAVVFVRCSECGRTGHPGCLDISEAMLPSVQSYRWTCMECKRCVECQDSGHEEQMMFCDKCDRGYHAFCVGLEEIPDGKWECPLCNDVSQKTASVPNRRRRTYIRRKSDTTAKKTRRSRKSPETEFTLDDEDDEEEEKVKPKRRRKRKKRIASATVVSSGDENSVTQSSAESVNHPKPPVEEPPPKRRRGRPRLSSADREKRKRLRSESRSSHKSRKRLRSPQRDDVTKSPEPSSEPPVTDCKETSIAPPTVTKSEEPASVPDSNTVKSDEPIPADQPSPALVAESGPLDGQNEEDVGQTEVCASSKTSDEVEK